MKTQLLVISSVFAAGCVASGHATAPSPLGRPASSAELLAPASASAPRVRLTRVDSARWQVDRAGLINLEHPRAEAAGLDDGAEPIVVSFWVLEHPTAGTYLVDSGVAAAFRDPDTAPVSSLVASQMNFDRLELQTDLATWLDANGPVAGVLLTHIHLDHIMGLPDLPDDVPVYAGPGETGTRAFLNMFVQGTLDDLLAGKGALREWQFSPDPAGGFEGVIDVFGDGSVFALHVPGHTAGSTAYLVRTTEGPRLIVGDASHTNWGWNHCVEPGEFSDDLARSARSLRRLERFAAAHPEVAIELSHQHYAPLADAEACDEPVASY